MKFWHIFLFELRSRFKKVSTYLYFSLFLIMGYMSIFTAVLGGGPLKNYLNAGVGSVLANAPYVLYSLVTMMSTIGILISAAIFGNAAHRDFKDNIFELQFSYSVGKVEYLSGRFAAAYVCLLFIFSGVGIGAWLANIMPIVGSEKLGPVNPSALFQPYLFGVGPNLFFTGALFFSIVLLTRKIFPSYLASLGLFMGYIIGLSLLQSQSPLLASLIDPFGQIAARNIYSFWTIAQKNTLLIPLSPGLLYNRLLWTVIGLGLLTFMAKKFQQSFLVESSRQRKISHREKRENEEREVFPETLPGLTAQSFFSFRSRTLQMISTSLHDFFSLVKNIYFLVILLLGILFMFFVGFRNVGLIRGTQTYPATFQVLEALGNLFMFFLFILIGFCAGELVWKERNRRFNEIYDTLPLPAWVPVLGKLGALFLVQILLMMALLFSGVLIQILQGYFKFDFAVYFQDLFGMRLATFLLMAVMALFLQVVANSKLLGYVLFTLFLILQDAVHMMGLEHHLLGYADLLGHTYSEMSGYGPYAARLFYFNLYYSAIAFLLIVLSILFWVRGLDTKIYDRIREAKKRTNPKIKIAGAAGILAVLLIGVFIFYNTNILNRYDSTRQVTHFRVAYEKKFKIFERKPLPQITDLRMNVDIYPRQKLVRSRGEMSLENRTDADITEVFVQFSREALIRSVDFLWPFKLKEAHPNEGVYIYELEKAMRPGGKTLLSYDQEISVRGFQNFTHGDVLPWINARLLENGTFLYPFDTVPALCYDPYFYYELSDSDRRKKYGLSPRERIPSLQNPGAARVNPMGGDASWINFEAIISTSSDQIALSAGELIKEWTEGERRFFHFRSEQKILKYFPILSARYSQKKDRWKDIGIEIYHHPDHGTNTDMMIKSVKMSLDYFTENFSPYPFKEIRIVEFPRYRIMAEGFPTIIPMSEGYGFIARFDGSKVAYVFRATAHEVAHQWWGHQVIGSHTEGVYFLMESLAQYSALMIIKKEYSRNIIDEYIKDRIEAYLKGRARETRGEAPLAFSNRDLAYVNYDKGMVVMNALQDYIGEDNLNAVIRNYIDRVAFQEPPYTTSLEFISGLREATPGALRHIVTDWLETITVNDHRGIQASREKNPDGTYRVQFRFAAQKYQADATGREKPVDLNDYIPFGVFDAQGNELFYRKYLVTPGTEELEFSVKGFPVTVGIDPHFLLIDKNTGDNLVEIKDRAVPGK